MHEKEHTENCFKRCGRHFSHVHAFLDQYYKQFGLSHRMLLHHKKGVELVVEKFGEEAQEPAEQHILEDAGCVPDDWKWYGEPLFLQLEDYDKVELELERLYPEEFKKTNQKT